MHQNETGDKGRQPARSGLQTLRSLTPAPMKRWLSDPIRVVAPKRTAYRRLRTAASPDPVTFSEKVLHKMAFDRRPLLRTLADKVAVREYVEDRAGQEILPQIYGVYAASSAIDWRALPREFVLKASHGSGAVAVIWEGAQRQRLPHPEQRATWNWRGTIHPDDLDTHEMTRLAQGWLGLSYELTSSIPEWAYAEIPPRIIAEELLRDAGGGLPDDYKFYMFDGHCAAIYAHLDRYGAPRSQWLSQEWTRLPARSKTYPDVPDILPKPPNLSLMLDVARELSRGVDFVRVDLYDLGSRVVFGELTNYPNAGKVTYEPREFDQYLGAAWVLPDHEAARY